MDSAPSICIVLLALLEPFLVLEGRELMATTWSARAALSSSSDMNRRLLSGSIAWRSMRPTPISTLALSLGTSSPGGHDGAPVVSAHAPVPLVDDEGLLGVLGHGGLAVVGDEDGAAPPKKANMLTWACAQALYSLQKAEYM